MDTTKKEALEKIISEMKMSEEKELMMNRAIATMHLSEDKGALIRVMCKSFFAEGAAKAVKTVNEMINNEL